MVDRKKLMLEYYGHYGAMTAIIQILDNDIKENDYSEDDVVNKIMKMAIKNHKNRFDVND